MLIIGLTGSIAMGKSTAATMLAKSGVPLFDADAAVHQLLGPGGAAVGPVLAAFPALTSRPDGSLDRAQLGSHVIANAERFRELERILHPLVRKLQTRFLARSRRQRQPMAVIDVPLLFETGGYRGCHATVVVSAPHFLQRLRALRRPGMTPSKLAGILNRQVPDAIKRRIASSVVPTGSGRCLTRHRLNRIIRKLRKHSRSGMVSSPPRRPAGRADHLIMQWRRR